ncbi:hypothetical protein K1719_023562 [Acacia pycnantha]|nr:hypothetical protein K1719_023562 [Acacia pycnantha]
MKEKSTDVAALTIKGASAFLNFLELATVLPLPAGNSPKDVQAAAAKASAINYHINRQETVDGGCSLNLGCNI